MKNHVNYLEELALKPAGIPEPTSTELPVPLPEFGSLHPPEYISTSIGNGLDSPINSGHRKLCISIHEPIQKKKKRGNKLRKRRATSHNTAIGPQISRKVIKSSDLSKWQVDMIRKDLELAKYLHIESERSEEEESKTWTKEKYRVANSCPHPKTLDGKARRMSKQMSLQDSEKVNLSPLIKSTELDYQSVITEDPLSSSHVEPKCVYVELEELHADDKTKRMEWVETARWLKYEEDLEKSDRWGKPHVSSLSFHSLLELRRGISKGIAIFDTTKSTLQDVAYEAITEFVNQGILEREQKTLVLRALLLKHKSQLQTKKKKRKSLDFLSVNRKSRAMSLFSNKPSTVREDVREETSSASKKRFSLPDEELSRLQKVQRRLSSIDPTLGAKAAVQRYTRQNSEPGRKMSVFDILQNKLTGFTGRGSSPGDLEQCILTNSVSEAAPLSSLTEETAETQVSRETREKSVSPLEEELNVVSNKLVSDVLDTVKQDTDTCSEMKKSSRGQLRKTVSFAEPRKSTFGLPALRAGMASPSPSAQFMVNDTFVGIMEEEEEEEDVRVLDAITKRVDTSASESDEMDITHAAQFNDDNHRNSTAQFIKRKLSRFLRSGSVPPDCEAAPVLVAKLDFLTKPLVAFIRLANAREFDEIVDIPIPVRFLFLVIGPNSDTVDYHEVGRSIATLMSNQEFQQAMYTIDCKSEILQHFNMFLNDSIVLPPGEYGHDHLLPKTLQKSIKKRKKQAAQIDEDKRVRYPAVGYNNNSEHYDPLSRTGRFFGGLIRDVKTLRKRYLSDIKDGLHLMTLESVLLMFGLMLAPAITFGGLAGKHTHQDYGVIEMLMSTCFGGLAFSLLTGQPLTVFGCTGPIYVFEVHLSHFCHNDYIHFDFLQWRAWIGCWIFLFFTSFSFLELGFLIHYFTRFTEEIVAVMVSLIFLYEASIDMMAVFRENPITSQINATTLAECQQSRTVLPKSHPGCPNTALFSLLLMLGTFSVAYCMKQLRHSHYLRQRLRSVMSGFGITVAMTLMIIVAKCTKDIYTEPLVMPEFFVHTSKRRESWMIDMFDTSYYVNTSISISYLALSAAIPAFLISVLIIMETHLTGVLVNKHSNRLVKGCSPNWDILLMGIILLVCAQFGLPWLCADSVRTMTHIKTLTVYSKYSAPGEKPRVLYIREQRITIVLVHLLVGLFLLFPRVIQSIPLAVLLGVFLFLGFLSLTGLQFVKRFKMLFMSAKYFPDYSFTKKIRTAKIHMFTLLQFILTAIMFGIKLSPGSAMFPICVIGIALIRRYAMKRIFTEEEVQELDKEDSESEEESDQE